MQMSFAFRSLEVLRIPGNQKSELCVVLKFLGIPRNSKLCKLGII